MILRNHGLVVGGTSITDAWHGVFCLKRAC